MKKSAALLALTFAAAMAMTAPAADDEKDFTPLFNGKDLTGWSLRNRSKPSCRSSRAASSKTPPRRRSTTAATL